MRLVPILVTAFLLWLPSTASAISLSIDGTTCGSCDGSDLFLNIVANSTGFDVTLTINADNYNGGKDGMVQVGFGGINGWTSVALTDSPSSSSIGWATPIGANVSSSGLCANGSSTGKICTSGFVDISSGGDYTWEFAVTGGTVATTVSGLHIGGQYADFADLSTRNGPRGNLISESGPSIPEPTAALLFCTGMLVTSRANRRSS